MIEAFGSFGQLAIPDDADAHRFCALASLVEGSPFREGQPLLEGHVETLALGRAELQHPGDRQTIGLHPRFGLPGFHIARVYFVERCVEIGGCHIPESRGALGNYGHEPNPVEPIEGCRVLGLRHGKKQVTADLFDAQLEKLPQDGQITGLVTG